jgi:hypothetical protein
MKPLAEVLPALKPMTTQSKCETGPDQQKLVQSWTGEPLGETGLSANSKSEKPALPTASNPIPNAAGALGLTLSMKSKEKALAEIRSNSEALEALRTFHAHALAMLEPAEPRTIAGLIEALTVHYWTKTMDAASMRIYVRDWIDDLGHLPPDVVHSACAQWRRGDNAFMPTPGKLLAIAEPIASFRTRLAERAADLISHV